MDPNGWGPGAVLMGVTFWLWICCFHVVKPSQHSVASLNLHGLYKSHALLILGNNRSPTCQVVHETKLTSEIFWPTHTTLAQSVEHQSDDLEVLDSIPTRCNFDKFVFCSSLCTDLSDNLTEKRIVKNANVSWKRDTVLYVTLSVFLFFIYY